MGILRFRNCWDIFKKLVIVIFIGPLFINWFSDSKDVFFKRRNVRLVSGHKGSVSTMPKKILYVRQNLKKKVNIFKQGL